MSTQTHLNQISARQHGLITRQQAIDAGLSAAAVDRRLTDRRWLALRSGVYAVGGSPHTWEQAVVAVCLAGGRGTVASHATAARLWDLERTPPADRIHVTSGPQRRIRLDGVVAHRSIRLTAADITTRHRIPVTAPARTIIEVSGLMGTSGTGKCIDDALRRGLVTIDLLRASVARLAGPGRRRLRVVRAALTDRLPGYDPGDSNLEVRALRTLAAAGLPTPTQQHRILIDGRTRRIDLAYPEAKVAIELDGWTWHGNVDAFHADRATRNELTSLGWAVLQITAEASPDTITRWVRDTLASRGSDNLRATA
jgi:hypothetical protein